MNWQAKSEQALKLPTSWQQLQHGQQYCAILSAYFSRWAHKIVGQQLLRIGGLSAELDCQMTAPYHTVISPEITSKLTALSQQNQGYLLQNTLDEIPFESQSIDACLLANTLNFVQDPHQLLREIQRILTDDGYLFLSVFNPCSPLLFKQNLAKDKTDSFMFRKFFLFRIIDWLELLNFDILQKQHIGNCCTAPLTVVVARKRTYPLTLQPQKMPFKPIPLFEDQPIEAFFSSK
ncbi:class I SAM-dependent methyltransferase [Pasteurellaceae bacterium 22721_9_1]